MNLEKYFNELVDVLRRHPTIIKAEVIRKTLLSDEGYIRAIAKTLRGHELHTFEYVIHGKVENTPTISKIGQKG